MEHLNLHPNQSKSRSRSKSVNRSEFLAKADELINGQRGVDYGDALENHQHIAGLWSYYLAMSGAAFGSLTPKDVALMMMLVKIARLSHASTDDSWIDLCGYAALGGEFLHRDDESADG